MERNSKGQLKKITNEEFLKRVKIANPNIEILEPFVNTKSYIKYRCLKCNYINTAIANSLLRGIGCPICAHNKRLTHEEYVQRMKRINSNIKILGKYRGGKYKIKYICLKCGYENEAVASDLLRRAGCPKCAGKVRFTQEEFEKVIKTRNKSIQILSKYNGARKDITYRCLVCGYEGVCKAYHLLEGHGCAKCCSPRGEKQIASFLDIYNIKYETQKKYTDLSGVNGGQLSYDFYLPDYNLLIEYQGEQHNKVVDYFGGEEGFKIRKEHDRRKKEYTKNHNIQLLEIWYNENIEQKLKETLNLETVETAGV